MGEVVRGQISDRPWGLTFGQFGLRAVSGQLTVHGADNRDYRVAFANGHVVGATSPLAADAATRIAMTNGLLSSTQAPTIARQIAATPEIDEIALLASACRLDPVKVQQLRRRVLVQRAARTFSVEQGSFVLDNEITIPVAMDADVDIRAVIYHGARMNLSELRLATELRELGSHFTLNKAALSSAERFGLDALEWPILDALRERTTLPELEARHRDLDPRSVQSVIYALVASRDCTAEQSVAPTEFAEPRTTSNANMSVSFRSARDSSQPSRPEPQAASRSKSGSRAPSVITDAPSGRLSGVAITRAATPPPTSPSPYTDDRPVPRATGSQNAVSPLRATTPPPVRAATEPPVAEGRTRTPLGNPPEPRVRTPIPSTPPEPRVRTPQSSTPPRPASPSSSQSNPALPRVQTNPVLPRAQTNPVLPRAQTNPALPRAQTNPAIPSSASSSTSMPRAGTNNPSIPRTSSSNPAMPRAGSSNPALPRAASSSPALPRAASNFDPTASGSFERPRTISSSPAEIGFEYSEGSDRARQALTQAAEAFQLGQAALRDNQLDTALVHLANASTLNPHEFDLSAVYAFAQFLAAPPAEQKKGAEKVRKMLNHALQKSTDPEQARFYLGQMEQTLGHNKEALAHYKAIAATDPVHPFALAAIQSIEDKGNEKSGGFGLFRKKT